MVWGTCAGMILLSNRIVGEKQGSKIKVCKKLLRDVNDSDYFEIRIAN